MKIAIIGAGPAGNYTAYLLAKQGHDVTIYEEHSQPGLPIQCTGILTEDLKNHIGLSDDYIVNRMQSVEVFAPNNQSFTTKNTDIIVCRKKFDNFLLKKAVSAGAKIEDSTKFLNYEKNQLTLKKQDKTIKTSAEIIIGADGPNSKVSKIINSEILKKYPTTFYFGAQATVKGNFKPNTYSVYLGNICPEFFAWVVPENSNQARIGLATKQTPNIHFNNLLKRLNIDESQITDKQGGLIPCYNPNLKLQHNNIYLIGDAATIIKSTTGGGIIPHLEAAETLVHCIKYNKDFNKELKRKKLYLHLIIRKFLDQFTDNDYNELIEKLNKSTANEVMQKYSRDDIIKLSTNLIIQNPSLVLYGLKHVKKIINAL